jgi:hypothetical protein
MEAKRKANGKLKFFDQDSTGLEFDFFKANSLPFYNASQTDFETTENYYHWKEEKMRNAKSIDIKIVEENKDAGFIIFKVKDESGEFYRILARHEDLVCSIKIFNKVMPLENQLDKLKTLHGINQN